MKKAIKATSLVLLLVGLIGVSCATTSCASSKSSGETMYQRQKPRSSVVKKTYKVRGNQKNNRSTYRTY